MKYFDAHTHTNFAAYASDRDEVMRRALDAEVGMNVIGTQKDTSAAAVALAEKYEKVYATIGLHPVHTSKSFHDVKEIGDGGQEFTSRGEEFDMSLYESLARHPKTIAIGECGLDYYRVEPQSQKAQKDVFIQHIEVANKVNKPLMLHIRDPQSQNPGGASAYGDALDIVKAHAKVAGDVHFFAGDWSIAKRFLDIGFSLSFTGVITFTHDYDEVIRNAPLEALLSETDAPYVAPVPHRGKRNEPLYVIETVRAMAMIRGESFETVRDQVLANAKRVFKIA